MKNSIIILIALLFVSLFSNGQTIHEKIDSLIKKSYQENPTVGISVGFIQHNAEYYTAYGKLNHESEIDINKNSIFEISSITKVLTSLLITQAVIDQKINLSDYIDSFLPKQYALTDELRNKIKISDLASHQSGLPDLDFRKLIALDPQQPVSSVTKQSLADMINNCKELIDYGQYRYSTIGFTLLGQILEQVYNQSYDEVIRNKLFIPLQLSNSLTKNFDVAHKTSGYNPNGGHQDFFNWNVTAPAGLIKSNAADMVTLLKAILDKKSPISKLALFAEKEYYQDEKRSMGLGLNIIPDGENTLYLKSGDSMGQSSMICYNRAKNWGIIILLNHRNSNLRQNLLNDIYETILK